MGKGETKANWISVKDEVPNNTNRVITWDGMFVQEASWSFITRDFKVTGFKFSNKITHWCKLPEPPSV